MPTPDQVQRVVYELALFQATMKYGSPLTERQRHVLKHKLYEVIFDVEFNDESLPNRSDQTPSELTS
jgi:hypothetical protein